MLEASLADMIRVHYFEQYFAANTVVVAVNVIITATTITITT
jgi:hypothetical protein